MRLPSIEDVLSFFGQYDRMVESGNIYERKQVYRLYCRDCHSILTDRGMSALLAADRNTHLYSTDLCPKPTRYIHGDYASETCRCRLRDMACVQCGNVVGYHVNVPCKTCLSQTSSRQYWMFRIPAIRASTIWLQVAEKQGDAPLLWGFVLDAAFFPPEYDRDDPEAEHKACQLAVRIPQGVRLVIREPRLMYVPAIGLVYPISASDEDLLPCR